MNGSSEQTDQRERFRVTIEIEPTDGNAWKAFEPASESSLYGRGETPPEAVENYALALRSAEEVSQ